jgi:hypothetical protein
VLPLCEVERSARLKNVVIDRGRRYPQGLVVGEDPEEDAKWFRVTEGGRHPDHPGHARPESRRMRHVLSVASECAPLVKTGGLADVVGALAGAMAAEGWQIRTLLPGYPAVLTRSAMRR